MKVIRLIPDRKKGGREGSVIANIDLRRGERCKEKGACFDRDSTGGVGETEIIAWGKYVSLCLKDPVKKVRAGEKKKRRT